MIPLRVHVEGFMSYRDEAELHFDGAPLWMLSGPNGAGKSTIFDAITYALYGLHRGGKQDARELINHSSDSLVVEFDFSVGNKAFRVRRTLSRRGRASFQALQLPIAGEKSSPRAVAETDSKAGLDRWIEEVIGLDESTFTASVLLQQGKSDALLEANPAKRHEMLSQIVDLSAYEALHQKADARRKDFETQARLLDSQLQGIEAVEPEEIERLQREAETARAQIVQCQQSLQELAALQVHAERFGTLQTERDEIEGALLETKVLFDQAEQIERDAQRWKQLNEVLPPLQRIVGLREQLTQARQRTQTFETDFARWTKLLEGAQRESAEVKFQRDTLSAEREEWRQQVEAAAATIARLSQPMHELEEMERTRAQLSKVDAILAQFAADLDERVRTLTEESTRLQDAKIALPWLVQWVRVRDDWCTQRDAVRTCRERVAEVEEKLKGALEQHVQVQAQSEEAAQTVQAVQDEVTQAKTLLAQAKTRLAQFETVDGAPECSLCGQELTPEHSHRERTRLQDEIERLQSTFSAAKERWQQAQHTQQTLTQRALQSAEEVRQLECDLQTHEAERKAAITSGKVAQSGAQDAIAALPETYRARLLLTEPEKFSAYFACEFPDDNDLQEVRAWVQEQQAIATQLEKVRSEQNRRDNYLSRREQPAARLLELETTYPAERVTQIVSEYEQAKAAQKNAEPHLQTLDTQIIQLDARRDQLETQIETARNEQADVQSKLVQETTRVESSQSTLEELEINLAIQWRDVLPQLDGKFVADLQFERDELSDAPQHKAELETARASHHTRLTRQKQIGDELIKIPEAARRAPAEIESEAEAVRAQEKHWTTLAGEAETEKSSLQERQARRAQLDTDYHAAEKQARLYKTLAELLGRDRLQRHLLQQAEASIVSNANHVLDRISGGTLRLELRRNDDENDDNRDAKAKIPKALDLIAYNLQTGGNALPVYLLSGSQRFRVAVSLALGIGQFAGGQTGHTLGGEESTSSTRRIESVIIDEGFGSLDQEGRREIIDELHNLKNVLSRIILVSHQEEFADAFPNRYLIELKDGTSSARIVQEV